MRMYICCDFSTVILWLPKSHNVVGHILIFVTIMATKNHYKENKYVNCLIRLRANLTKDRKAKPPRIYKYEDVPTVSELEACLFFQKTCCYCPTKISFEEMNFSLDRLDNSLAHVKENIMFSCRPCNTGRQSMSADECYIWRNTSAEGTKPSDEQIPNWSNLLVSFKLEDPQVKTQFKKIVSDHEKAGRKDLKARPPKVVTKKEEKKDVVKVKKNVSAASSVPSMGRCCSYKCPKPAIAECCGDCCNVYCQTHIPPMCLLCDTQFCFDYCDGSEFLECMICGEDSCAECVSAECEGSLNCDSVCCVNCVEMDLGHFNCRGIDCQYLSTFVCSICQRDNKSFCSYKDCGVALCSACFSSSKGLCKVHFEK